MPSPNDPTEIGRIERYNRRPNRVFGSSPTREPERRRGIRHFPARDTQAIHEELLSQLHPERLIQARPEDKEEMRKAIINIIARRRMPYSGVERDQLADSRFSRRSTGTARYNP